MPKAQPSRLRRPEAAHASSGRLLGPAGGGVLPAGIPASSWADAVQSAKPSDNLPSKSLSPQAFAIESVTPPAAVGKG
eukprot:scaffold522390_cov39-Prasinocladus_malaysianus.AAC.1